MGKVNKRIIWVAGLLAISMLNISSICTHYGPKADLAIIDRTKREAPTATPVSTSTSNKEITWKMLANVEFKDVFLIIILAARKSIH